MAINVTYSSFILSEGNCVGWLTLSIEIEAQIKQCFAAAKARENGAAAKTTWGKTAVLFAKNAEVCSAKTQQLHLKKNLCSVPVISSSNPQ